VPTALAAGCVTALQDATWRQWIDLEHSTVYSDEIHWNALTDGHTKFIFHALTGEEQLFDLDEDPREATELRAEPRRSLWRNRMVAQFQREGRGPEWVKDGRLVPRPNGCTYSPNYPSSVSDADTAQQILQELYL